MRISVCHCLACQRRSGSAFGVQAWFPLSRLSFAGQPSIFKRVGDSGGEVTYRFCPGCGTTLWWEISGRPGFAAVAVGTFGDPAFFAPGVSIYEARRHPWVSITGEVEHLD